MSCNRAETEDLVERYLRADLPETERAAFEEHFFECDDCFQELQAAVAVREVLASGGPRRHLTIPQWLPIAAAVAGVAVTAALMVGKRSPSRQVVEPVVGSPPAAIAVPAPGPLPADLLRVDPPPYVAIVMRGAGASRTLWDTAMKRYDGQDYGGAAVLLRRVHRQSPTAASDFYLGICELMASRDADGERLLSGVAASGDPVYAGPALLYLGKARLRLGRVEEAREPLRRLAGSGGPGSETAAELLRRLPGSS